MLELCRQGAHSSAHVCDCCKAEGLHVRVYGATFTVALANEGKHLLHAVHAACCNHMFYAPAAACCNECCRTCSLVCRPKKALQLKSKEPLRAWHASVPHALRAIKQACEETDKFMPNASSTHPPPILLSPASCSRRAPPRPSRGSSCNPRAAWGAVSACLRPIPVPTAP